MWQSPHGAHRQPEEIAGDKSYTDTQSVAIVGGTGKEMVLTNT